MADNGAGIDSLANAVIKLTGEVSEMRGEMRSFMDHKLAAEQRIDIRAETEEMIRVANTAQSKAEAADRRAEISQALAEAKAYADARDEKLEQRLSDQEDRDKKREADIRTQFIGIGVIGIGGLAYALYNLMTRGAP